MNTDRHTAYDKQKDLLASTTGHFSLLKALHMADYITELNGMLPL
jgi:CDP-diacylglycerol--serine O-phosphatidyltransferase